MASARAVELTPLGDSRDITSATRSNAKNGLGRCASTPRGTTPLSLSKPTATTRIPPLNDSAAFATTAGTLPPSSTLRSVHGDLQANQAVRLQETTTGTDQTDQKGKSRFRCGSYKVWTFALGFAVSVITLLWAFGSGAPTLRLAEWSSRNEHYKACIEAAKINRYTVECNTTLDAGPPRLPSVKRNLPLFADSDSVLDFARAIVVEWRILCLVALLLYMQYGAFVAWLSYNSGPGSTWIEVTRVMDEISKFQGWRMPAIAIHRIFTMLSRRINGDQSPHTTSYWCKLGLAYVIYGPVVLFVCLSWILGHIPAVWRAITSRFKPPTTEEDPKNGPQSAYLGHSTTDPLSELLVPAFTSRAERRYFCKVESCEYHTVGFARFDRLLNHNLAVHPLGNSSSTGYSGAGGRRGSPQPREPYSAP